jgi:hypothetical protein
MPARLAILTAAALLGCGPPPVPTPRPAVQPVLDAVLRGGTPLTFARYNARTVRYEMLPGGARILRLISAYPGGSDRMRVTLTPLGGAPRELAWVGRDDRAGQQAHDATGYYELAVDRAGYSVIVTPAPAERAGGAFTIDLVNLSPGGTPAESPPLTVAMGPRAVATQASDVFFDCGNDYDAVDGRWHFNCKSSGGIVARDFTLQGWLAPTPGAGPLGPLWIEDYHYTFFPDPAFVDEYYGRDGVFASILGSTQSLESLVLPGNPPVATPPVMLGDSRGITINSFLLPGNAFGGHDGTVRAELNAWHIANQGDAFSRHWVGRGPAPPDWITPVIDANDPHHDAWHNTAWPYDPRRPDLVTVLTDQYVRVTGPLWQDVGHDENPEPDPVGSPWAFLNPRLGAWLEIHPVDHIEPLLRQPPIRRRPFLVDAITNTTPTSTQAYAVAFGDEVPPGYALRCRELIDDRYTDASTVTYKRINLRRDDFDVRVAVARQSDGRPGRFKAVYVIWWEPGPVATACEPG